MEVAIFYGWPLFLFILFPSHYTAQSLSLPDRFKPLLPGLQHYPTIPITRSLPGFLGSLQCFFEGMAVVCGHIGGEDRSEMSQRRVQ